jgi:large subunit GTPase 1
MESSTEASWVKMRSITQERPLDEFLSTAELAGTDFTTERTASIRIMNQGKSSTNPYLLTREEQTDLARVHFENLGKLTVPRRPRWNSTMTPSELDRLEKDAFLEWRRGLAVLQEDNDLLLTPFERNIEVWRQLWRVVDRSDLVVQIVDARNPLLFRSVDLEKYVNEIDDNKTNLLLINKADLLSLKQRQIWADYFVRHGIEYAFFSAKAALVEQEQRDDSDNDDGEDNDESEDSKDGGDDNDENKVAGEPGQRSPTHVLSVEELELLFLSQAPQVSGKLNIGLVGYPNVGKSSSINALIGAKKVSVSSTPGKTKHFQTIMLSPEVILCDCPGLVFPNFATTNGDLVCNGVLPIDQLREVTGPVQLIAQRIPKYFLEAIYGISIFTKPVDEGGTGIPTAEEVLVAYARARGFMRSGQGNPDESRAARYVLKDYVNAKLLYCQPPPDYGSDSSDPGAEFNKEIYRLDMLPEQRRTQIVVALRAANPDVDLNTVDLARELDHLKFSQHESMGVESYAAPTLSLKVNTASSNLDRDFFAQDGVRGVTKKPFHLAKEDRSSSKKHFKKNKKAQKGDVGGPLSYGGQFGDLY